jgi:hypothetical protein
MSYAPSNRMLGDMNYRGRERAHLDSTTHIHYTSDVRPFFAWAEKSPDAIIGRRCWLLSGLGWYRLVPHASVF